MATKRIRKLERELARKEKALADAAALLILKKTVEGLCNTEHRHSGILACRAEVYQARAGDAQTGGLAAVTLNPALPRPAHAA